MGGAAVEIPLEYCCSRDAAVGLRTPWPNSLPARTTGVPQTASRDQERTGKTERPMEETAGSVALRLSHGRSPCGLCQLCNRTLSSPGLEWRTIQGVSP